MTLKKFCAGLLAGAACVAMQPSAAQEQGDALETVVVSGIHYRSDSAAVSPTLEYNLDYFQPFEPATAGDMLKRVPSVAFLSDVGEFDGVRLRGLDPGYTQVLINGKKVPGADVDRSFWVDRIPAELIERVEIMRSASADRSGDAMAGALNIVLRDSVELDGGYARAGGLYFRDGELKPIIGGVWGGNLAGPVRGLFGFNVQGRYNPKEKVSLRYEPDSGVFAFSNREDQQDTRDGTDYSANGEISFPLGAGKVKFSGFYVHTDREEQEYSYEYENFERLAHDAIEEFVYTPQHEDIAQDNYTLALDVEQPMLGGKTGVSFSYARFIEDISSLEEEGEYEDFTDLAKFKGTLESVDTDDREFSLRLDHKRDVAKDVAVKFGFEFTGKKRYGLVSKAKIKKFGATYPELEAVPGGDYAVDETRYDSFVKFTGTVGALEWEGGLRYEMTETTVDDRDGGVSGDNDYGYLLPSLSLRYNIDENGRITASAARTVRRPNFDYLTPALLEEEPTEDNDFIGNASLDPESAWGFDIGYERQLGNRGVAGINVFYRSVGDLTELVSTGAVSSSGDGYVFQPANVGNGTVWGVELDFSAPLTFLGLDDTGLFFNYSWLDSTVTDPVTGTHRRFNDQAGSVYNVGLIHNIPAWGTSLGVSYRKQGSAFSRVMGETVTTSYGGDLEAFVEKRLGDHFILRLAGSNLLDASKDETFYKWDTLSNQLSGDLDDISEYELEREKSGARFQLVLRYTF